MHLFQAYRMCYYSLIFAVVLKFSDSKECHGIETCYKSSRDSKLPIITERDVMIEAMCFTACVDRLHEYCDCEINLYPTWEGQWHTFSAGSPTNCSAYQKVTDCQRGCVIQAKNVHLTSHQCRDQCFETCPGNCNNEHSCYYDKTECVINCRRPMCFHGCDLFLNELSNTSEGPSPHNPSTRPILVSTDSEDGGAYMYSTVNYSTVFPWPKDTLNDMSAFLFRIESHNFTVFTWKWTYYGYLNLEFATCQDVNISFRAVTRYNTSDYSPVLNICIDGEKRYPSQVSKHEINFYFVEDFRPGFVGHANTTILWNKPEGWQYLTSYQLTIFSQSVSCGGLQSHTYTIDKDATNYTISAVTPDKPIFFSCSYLVRLISEPTKPNESHIEPIFMTTESITTVPTMTLSCGTEYHLYGTVDIYAEWTVSDSPGLLEAISKFSILPQEIYIEEEIKVVTEWYNAMSVTSNINESTYYTIFKNMRTLEKDRKYRLQVDAISNQLFPWRPMPSYVNCIIEAYHQLPKPVNGVTIELNELAFSDENLYFIVSWAHPNHNIKYIRFEVRIAREPAKEYDHFSDYPFIQTEENTTMSIINTSRIYQLEIIPCLYLQLRFQNGLLKWSSWSDPIVLHKHPDVDPHCNGTLPIISTSPEPTLRAESNNVAENHILSFTIIGGSVFVCLFSIIILLIVTGVVLHHKKKKKEKTRRTAPGQATETINAYEYK